MNIENILEDKMLSEDDVPRKSKTVDDPRYEAWIKHPITVRLQLRLLELKENYLAAAIAKRRNEKEAPDYLAKAVAVDEVCSMISMLSRIPLEEIPVITTNDGTEPN